MAGPQECHPAAYLASAGNLAPASVEERPGKFATILESS